MKLPAGKQGKQKTHGKQKTVNCERLDDTLFDMEDVKSKKTIKYRIKLNVMLLCAAMFLFGVFTSTIVRFVLIKDTSVHYHANFDLYINGQKDEFKNFTFYEEVAACNADDHNNVKSRVHMHDNKPGLIHVHANAVTWGQFFANLGYTLGNKVVVTDSGVYSHDTNENKLTFTLNGKNVTNIESRLIKSEDRLLISYGKEDLATLKKRWESVPKDAQEANTKPDPAACSGANGLSAKEKLKQAIGISAPHN